MASSISIRDPLIPVFLHKVLKPSLPYCLPIYRRCQFHLQNSASHANAEIWVAAHNLDLFENELTEDTLTSLPETSQPWIAAHIDVTNPGQTQVWLYASWEPSQANASTDPSNPFTPPRKHPDHEALFTTLFTHLRTKHISRLSHSPPQTWLNLRTSGKILSQPFRRSKVLFGTLAECLWIYLDQPTDKTVNEVTRSDRGYLKYVFTFPRNAVESVAAPEGFHFTRMPDSQLQIIIDRTSIPRTLETIKQFVNVGLFDANDTPVAWGLLGKDASLSSLHTEPEYRGRGFAELVSKRLIAVQDETFRAYFEGVRDGEEGGIIYAMADVSGSNLASRRVMEKLGGKVMWKVGWLEIDVGEENGRMA